ncbi:MAG: N-acetylmuramoyl-L-alanine amidase [Coriobacteriales bacterium]|jgi:peptidoglycan hydrolase-like protein with peptidoglycan-binding domain|nr:N-acetylmuramoyl-L-alanine amidase [Coriobacteriales bacterium]
MPSIEFLPCHPSNYRSGRRHAIDQIAIHYTAGAQTSAGAANANARYFNRQANIGASAHYFIDDGDVIWQSVADTDCAWAVAQTPGNDRSISIEVCSAGVFTEREIETLTWLVQRLMSKYGIPASGVYRHYDYSGKYCPAAYITAQAWWPLRAQITGGTYSGTTAVTPSPAPATGGFTLYRYGSTGDVVKEIQRAVGAGVDGIWGKETDAKVRAYQASHGLVVDGIVGPATMAKIRSGAQAPAAAAPSTRRLLRRGSTGSDVKELQQALRGRGYSIAADGIFGSATDVAVRSWQRQCKLSVDGIAGPKTYASLGL